MSSRRCLLILVLPMIAMSLSCASGRPATVAVEPMTTDQMLAVGLMFEQQGRFVQAQDVYQQVLQRDPVSPAAERLLDVIAANDVINSQNLPLDRLMSVGQFYERKGNLEIAQGLYSQILEHHPDFDAARERLAVLAAHEPKVASKSPSQPGRHYGIGATSPQTALGNYGISQTGAALVTRSTPETKRCPSCAKNHEVARQSQQKRSTSSGTPTNHWQPTQENMGSSDVLEVDYEVPVPTPESASVQLTGAQDQLAQRGQPSIPPSPVNLPPGPTPGPSMTGVPRPTNLKAENRAAELWQDTPLGQLKASISVNYEENGKLRESEVAQLSKAAPLIAASGTSIHSVGVSRPWMLSSYQWEAPATRSLPLWFEEPNLERMGYTYGFYWNVCGCESGPWAAQCLQPFVSGAHFWGRVAAIPYLCAIDPPCEPVYTLGVDRPGSPVPYRKHLVPISLMGVVYQAGAVVGMTYLIP